MIGRYICKSVRLADWTEHLYTYVLDVNGQFFPLQKCSMSHK